MKYNEKSNPLTEEELSQASGGFIVLRGGKYQVKDDRTSNVVAEFDSLNDAVRYAKEHGLSTETRGTPGVIMV